MKKLLCLIAFFLWAGTAMAAPFVVSDAYPVGATQPDGFTVSLDNGPVVESPADPVTASSARFKFDVGGVAEGSHTLRVKAFKNDAVWGRLESTEAVFTFTRPASPISPSGLKLSQ